LAKLIVFNKPWGVICQFRTPQEGGETLADYIPIREIYPAGRLDKDSEGLVLLTDSGALQARISQPDNKMPKSYWVQVEGDIHESALLNLRAGVQLREKGGKTWTSLPAKVARLSSPPLQERIPPVRKRRHIPTSWLNITLKEGKNRQIRRMTAATGFPSLRIYRYQIGHWTLDDLGAGEFRQTTIHLPE